MTVQMLIKVYVKLTLQYFNRIVIFADVLDLLKVENESRTLFQLLTTRCYKESFL